MSKRPFILLTNDDGIDAEGLKHLWNALKDFADIAVVAPTVEQSGVSLSITLRHPIKIKELDWHGNTKAWCVQGTPADCVKIGLAVLLKQQPDLVVSGINCGTNAGRNSLYSGTVAAAMEAALHDVPSVAFSCIDHLSPNYKNVEKHVLQIVKYVLDISVPSEIVWNVNFPKECSDGFKGFKMARQGREFWTEDPLHRINPSSEHLHYWMGGKIRTFSEDEDSDIALLAQGFGTIVPLHIGDLTHHKHYQEQKDLVDKFFAFNKSN